MTGRSRRAGRICRAGIGRRASFNLPERLRALVPEINGEATTVLMHNDAVVQGLSEIPCMQDVDHWGVLTIGTGLGNARFTNLAQS